MQNFDLLKALGKIDKPVLLKRGLANTIEEWIMAAEYIMAGGNKNVILCERGIRTFEKYTRNTLDLSVVPDHQGTHASADHHRPVACDRGLEAGGSDVLSGDRGRADGLIIEVHACPEIHAVERCVDAEAGEVRLLDREGTHNCPGGREIAVMQATIIPGRHPDDGGDSAEQVDGP